ncbi:MAG TPA: MaoC family dehydratase [Accumulibacter sp.]|nr:MaoC family dehydratase [Accumulibacter sp.]
MSVNIHVGDTLPELTLPPVTRATLALYAGASGDHNPIHIDIDMARKAGMPDVFAHGMLSMAWLSRFLTGWQPQTQLRTWSVRFLGITHLGDKMTCSGRVVEVFEEGGEQRAKLEIQTSNQNGEVKIAGEAIVGLS